MKTKSGQLPSSTLISWKKIHQEILETLVDAITSAPVLAYPDFKKTFYCTHGRIRKGVRRRSVSKTRKHTQSHILCKPKFNTSRKEL